MSEQLDLVELNNRAIEAVARRDFDAALRDYDPDATWDLAQLGLGTMTGIAEIRAGIEEWTSSYDEFTVEIEEATVLGECLVFAVARQRGRVVGSSGWVQLRYASVTEWGDGRIVRVTPYVDVEEARAAAKARAGNLS